MPVDRCHFVSSVNKNVIPFSRLAFSPKEFVGPENGKARLRSTQFCAHQANMFRGDTQTKTQFMQR